MAHAVAAGPRFTSSRASWTPFQRVKNDLIYALLRAVMWAVGCAPVRLSVGFGCAAGALAFWLAPWERRKAIEGLERSFPERSSRWCRATARRCFREIGRGAAEVCHIQRGLDIERYVSFPSADREVLDSALARGRGVIWVTAHLGNWELLAAGLGARGYVVRPFAKESYDPRLTSLIDRWRREMGVETIWRRQGGGSAKISQTFADGGILGVLMDQDTDVRSVFVPFFGRPARTPSGAAELAHQGGVPLLAGFVRRVGTGASEAHEITVHEVPFDAEAHDVTSTTATLTAAIEQAIRRQPEGWVWFHDRWRTRPTDEVERP